MHATTTQSPPARLTRLASLAAAILLLTGCAVQSSKPDPGISSWDEAFDAAYGEEGENLTEIDGIAEDFPTEIPLPEGELVLSMAGDGVWDMIFETEDSEAQAEQLLEAIGQIVAPADELPRNAEGGLGWTFFDEGYAIYVQMQPGPWPPPMVAISVVQR